MKNKSNNKNYGKNIIFKKYGSYIILVILIILLYNLTLLPNKKTNSGFNIVKSKVIDMKYDDTDKDIEDKSVNEYRHQEFNIKILEGEHKNEIYLMRNSIETIDVYNIKVNKGDKIFVSLDENDNNEIDNIHIYDKARENYLYGFMAIFFILLLIIGRSKGANSIITLVFTGFMIIKVLLPLILKGYSPINTTIVVCIIIVSITLTVISGFNKKTFTAILGTLGGVIVAGVLALIVGKMSQISGLANDNAQMLAYLPKRLNMDFKGILFAGIIIGALGAVMDVAMSISSSMYEIQDIKPDIKTKDLIKSGMNIGRDIMGSMSNTLILAYTGGAFELMLLFMAAKMSIREIINLDMVAAEIIRAVAGSIGLACTIPLTVTIAAIFYISKS